MGSQDILERAYDILGEYGIGRGAYAQDENGQALPLADPRATKFCSVGAISRAALDLGYIPLLSREHQDAILRLRDAIHPEVHITNWNDKVATDEEIKQAFRAAAGIAVTPPAAVENKELVLV